MPTFTVHAPPRREGEAPATPDRFVFVRDGFHGWAFLLAPFWLIAHRLWLALLLYVVATVAVAVGLAVLGASAEAQALAAFVIALLVGFEAASLRRWTLTRRRWATLGFVVGDDRDNAEHRFYSQWAARGPAVARAVTEPPPSSPSPSPSSSPPPPTLASRRGPPSGHDVIGLFPEPGANR